MRKGEEVQSDSSYDTDLAASSDSGDDSNSDTEFNPDAEIVDEEDEYDLPMFTYDADDPCIDVNVVFPDTDQCKLAVTHHAVLHDHAFDIVKKDKIRFRAKCKRAQQGCKWTFFCIYKQEIRWLQGKCRLFGSSSCKCTFFYDLFSYISWCRLRQVDQSIHVVHSTSVVRQWPLINGWLLEWTCGCLLLIAFLHLACSLHAHLFSVTMYI